MGDITETMKEAIQEALPDGKINVQGSGGHFVIEVVSKEFAGKRIIQQHRLVLGAIAHLMKGDNAPVHAIDKLTCTLPEE
jgi:acid stress-induced BolA-like protein IbaG/YrbA